MLGLKAIGWLCIVWAVCTPVLAASSPPVPDDAALIPGMRFFCFGESLHGLVAADGKPAQDVDVVFSLLSLREVNEDTLVFTSEETGKTYRFPLKDGGRMDVKSLPGIYPVVEDTEVAQVRNRFLGKTVWHYPHFWLKGRVFDPWFTPPYGGFTANYRFQSAVVSRVLRLRMRTAQSTDGGSGVTTCEPLLIQLTPLTGFGYAGADEAALWNMSDVSRDVLFMERGQIRCYALFAGSWEVERSLALISPVQSQAGWSLSVRSVITVASYSRWKYVHLRKGMTPDMVAWILGWPPVQGTKAELRRQATWVYCDDWRGNVSIEFRNGRVVRWSGSERYEDVWNPP